MLADRLRRALPGLPPQLATAGRFLASRPYDAATRSMRALAADAGTSPASFTRLAQALGYEGWDALRAASVEEHRHPAPFSRRVENAATHGFGALRASDLGNVEALASLPERSLTEAAATLHAAPRIHVAGFRSCRAVATLLHYQLRLFRPETVLVGDGALEMDIGAMRAGEALVVIGFAPYSIAGLTTATAARGAGLRCVVLADAPDAPLAYGADHLLCYPNRTPAFFPSLTAAISLAQALADVCFSMGGAEAMARLKESEARLAAIAAYIPSLEDNA